MDLRPIISSSDSNLLLDTMKEKYYTEPDWLALEKIVNSNIDMVYIVDSLGSNICAH